MKGRLDLIQGFIEQHIHNKELPEGISRDDVRQFLKEARTGKAVHELPYRVGLFYGDTWCRLKRGEDYCGCSWAESCWWFTVNGALSLRAYKTAEQAIEASIVERNGFATLSAVENTKVQEKC